MQEGLYLSFKPVENYMIKVMPFTSLSFKSEKMNLSVENKG